VASNDVAVNGVGLVVHAVAEVSAHIASGVAAAKLLVDTRCRRSEGTLENAGQEKEACVHLQEGNGRGKEVNNEWKPMRMGWYNAKRIDRAGQKAVEARYAATRLPIAWELVVDSWAGLTYRRRYIPGFRSSMKRLKRTIAMETGHRVVMCKQSAGKRQRHAMQMLPIRSVKLIQIVDGTIVSLSRIGLESLDITMRLRDDCQEKVGTFQEASSGIVSSRIVGQQVQAAHSHV
jgi:hypothetical protein